MYKPTILSTRKYNNTPLDKVSTRIVAKPKKEGQS